MPDVYSHNVVIKYMGGDPRIVFVKTFEEECYVKGELASIGTVEEVSEETKINKFNP